MTNVPDSTEVPAAWQQRFAFFQQYGPVGSTPEAKAAYRALPFGARMRLGFNIWAFLFGPVYFLVKGMWRKGLTVLGVAVTLGVASVLLGVPDNWDRAFAIGFTAAIATVTNWAYYLHVAEGSQSWNPLEGLRRKGPA
ncbi:hypothetical protein MCHIJ_24600 [Mycolicibacterium chitae]|uniref:Protein of uncharacterized function (DUF2628) n=1 Tax=Mycolicibacterium chitae TaxID=1792 RepID=A0A448I1D0_MYCCI|nr:DUF2628 domain-containing protein [Mycolicibacterium chitae]MCV7108583.1 DUF2628 domain-containing protein [Mycolicibacterium chitae]BBZ03023.1 hypothetical protein MCHIJ_24600 [Mycolicibacterium chitae]VEG46153.1 Protein of uncharacterised function (DUF2628) [Mycolicibacterium chitae]